MRIAVCFACDEAYFPLCKGLVLSLGEAARFFNPAWDVSLHFIDIGCRDESLSFLTRHGAAVHAFDRRAHLPNIRGDRVPPYADAQLCRPFLPGVVPDKDVYLWIDCDIWVQGKDAVPVAADAAAHAAGKIVICPEYHYGYIGQRDLRLAVMAHARWYTALYGEEAASELSYKPMFNSGFFALEARSPLWAEWAAEVARLYATDGGDDPYALHFAEQFALNRVAHRERAFVPLDPLFNYACGGSAVILNPRGKAAVGYPPFTPVQCAHLLDFSRYGRMYLEKRLLYRKGEYLTEAERAALVGLVKRPA